MKKIYVLTNKHDALFETFKSFDAVINRIDQINKEFYNGDNFGIFGAPYDYETGNRLPYFIDSACLVRINQNIRSSSIYDYHTFLIHAIDLTTGEKTELE